MVELAQPFPVLSNDSYQESSDMCKPRQTWDHGSFPQQNDWFADFRPTVTGVSNNFAELTAENLRTKETQAAVVSKEKTTATKKRRASESSASSSSSGGKTRKNKKAKSPVTTSKQEDSDEQGRSSLTCKGYQRHYAKHDYHDFANVKPTELDLQNIKAARGGVHNPFPAVLHCMMEQSDAQGYGHIISWQPHGRAFRINDTKKFVECVLPMYFKHSKLSSFQRQLSLYGFVRLSHDGPDRGAYYHQCFLRGRPFLCSNIQRTRVKGTWVRTSSSPDTEPDFYTMEPVQDLHQLQEPQQQEKTSVVPSWMRSSDTPTAMGMAEDNSSNKIQALIDEAIKSTTGCDIMNCSTTLVPAYNDIVITDPEQPVQFIDKENDSLKGDFSIQMNRPPAVGAALQPPPAFPTNVVTANATTFDQQDYSMPTEAVPRSPTLNTKRVWPSCHDEAPLSFKSSSMADLTLFASHHHRHATLPSLPLEFWNDDELAAFLTDIDLETEMDSELDGLVRTAMV